VTTLTLDVGFPGDELELLVRWHDHNNIPHCQKVVVRVLDRDKPRTLSIGIAGGPSVTYTAFHDGDLDAEVEMPSLESFKARLK